MKQVLWIYALLSLSILALFSVLSYGQDHGYVYIHWLGWQLQTNLWVLLIVLILLSGLGYLIWLVIKAYLNRQQRKHTQIESFKHLHPYEQLAVIWLLDAAQEQSALIAAVFQPSGVLKGVMSSKLNILNANYDAALKDLNFSHSMAFELAELQRIEIYLKQNQGEQVLTHLEFLQQHQLSPWLAPISQSYQQRLAALWEAFAVQFPWLYLHRQSAHQLSLSAEQAWLSELSRQFEQASESDKQQLQQYYQQIQVQLADQSYEIRVLWLKLYSRLETDLTQQRLWAEQLLAEQFNQDVFYLWFQQQFLAAQADYALIEQKILLWKNKYSNLPVLDFAQWHIYQAKGDCTAADELLTCYPEHILFHYLRIKSRLNNHPDLLKQLNTIFENNVHYMSIKL